MMQIRRIKPLSLLLSGALLMAAPVGFAAPAKPKPAMKPKPVTKPKAAPAKPKSTVKPKPKPTPTPHHVAEPTPTPVPAEPTPTPMPTATPTPSYRASDTWALLVGVSKYQNSNINSLRYPASDATAIRDALVAPEIGGLPPSNVKLITDDEATQSNISNAVDSFLKPHVKEGDKVIVFLAGHGIAKGVGINAKSYLLPTDVRGLTSQALESSGVDLKEMSKALTALPASQFVVFVDACREDPSIGRGMKGNVMSDILSRSIALNPTGDRPASAVTFFACSVGQRAFEDPRLEHGVFTYWILDGIREAHAADPEDGDVNMGRLSSYVSAKVDEWAKKVTAEGDFEVSQTPEMLSNANGTVVLVQVQKDLPKKAFPVTKPELVVASLPEGAHVKINGRSVGTAPLIESVPTAGEYTVSLEAPGYEPVEKVVKALDGYQQQVVLTLEPSTTSRGMAGIPNPMGAAGSGLFQKAVDAEAQSQWEVALAGYNGAIMADPKFAPAYERLSDLQLRRDDPRAAVDTLIKMVAQVPPSVSALSRLSRAYSTYATKLAAEEKDTGKRKKKKGKLDVRTYGIPQNADEAAAFARKAADEAVKLDSNAVASQLALGFALIAGDDNGKNKNEASQAFGKAALSDANNADAQFGLGYCIRYFAQFIKSDDQKKTELKRAIDSLNKAISIRPDFYEAHRELAYALHMSGDTAGAMKEYELANANRGGATDKDEVAGVNVALSGLHKQAAENSSGEEKKRHEEASEAYMEDAKETGKDMDVAMKFLQFAGVGGNLMNFLPPGLSRALGILQNPEEGVKNEIRRKIKIPGGFGF